MNASTKAIFLETLGCQMNLYDSEILEGRLRQAGYKFTSEASEADIVIYNTCSVRRKAEEKIYSRLGEMKHLQKLRPHLLVVVIGCMAQREAGDIIKKSPVVRLVAGTRRFVDLPELIEEALRSDKPIVAVEEDRAVEMDRDVSSRPNKFQAFVAIMRGCNNYCAYCVVPYVRGPEVSRPEPEVLDECRRLVDDGVVEITLLGQNVNSYKGGPDGFCGLLRRTASLPGLKRLRFVTNHPKDLSENVTRVMAENPVICEHLHLPAQSGSNKILRAMGRGYTREHYLGLLEMARRIVPGVEFVSDFIVGFPGETEEDFADTKSLIEQARYQNAYVFRYSPRPNTVAADIPDDVPKDVKARRNAELLAVQNRISAEAQTALLNKKVEALIEGPSKSDPENLTGRTRTNRIVLLPLTTQTENLVGQIVKLEVTSVTPLSLFCRLP